MVEKSRSQESPAPEWADTHLGAHSERPCNDHSQFWRGRPQAQVNEAEHKKEESGDRRDAGLLLGDCFIALLRVVNDEAPQPTMPLPMYQQNLPRPTFRPGRDT